MKAFYFLSGFVVLAPCCASAQVTVNPAALQQLVGIAPTPSPSALPKTKPAPPQKPWHKHATMATQKPPVSKPEAPKPPAPKPAMVPAVVAPALAPKPAPAATVPKPVLLKFAPGSTDLPPDAAALIKPFCTVSGDITIDARAPNTPGDPSAAMRLSLARAIAVHDALEACGVPAQNILPRALGAVPGQDEDEAVLGSAAQ